MQNSAKKFIWNSGNCKLMVVKDNGITFRRTTLFSTYRSRQAVAA